MIAHRAKLPIAALLLTCLFAASAAIACAIGRTQPPPEIVRQLHLTDCALPCWLGIVPGETISEDAFQRLAAAFPNNTIDRIGDDFAVILKSGTDLVAIVVINTSHMGVFRIHLTTDHSGKLRLGDIVASSGQPSCFDFGARRSVLIYLSETVEATVEASGIGRGWWQSADSIYLVSRAPGFNCW